MYFRKFWRDNRLSFIVYLTVVLAGSAALVLIHAAQYSNETGWSLVRGAPHQIERAWFGAVRGVTFGGLVLAMLAGVALGATGVGEEFKSGTLEFLLTRPRRRRYFIWTGWAAGMVQILAIFLANAILALALLISVTGLGQSWRLLLAVPAHVIIGGVTFGLSYFLTVLARNSRLALQASVILTLAYTAGAALVRHWWKIQAPTFWDLIPGAPAMDGIGLIQGTAAWPVASMAGWSLLALAFPLAAQWLFDRAEL